MCQVHTMEIGAQKNYGSQELSYLRHHVYISSPVLQLHHHPRHQEGARPHKEPFTEASISLLSAMDPLLLLPAWLKGNDRKVGCSLRSQGVGSIGGGLREVFGLGNNSIWKSLE